MTQPIVFRADMSVEIGTGHVRRCLSLADACRDLGAETVFVTRDLGLDAAAMIGIAGHACAILPAPLTAFAPSPDAARNAAWAGVEEGRDAVETLAAIDRPATIVVDHYAFTARWHRQVRACGPIVVIDDLADRPLAADLLVDYNPSPDHRAKYAERLSDPAPILGGPRYALLGSDYRAGARNRAAAEVESIGVFMGGADAIGASAIVLDAIRIAGFTGPIELVTTQANPHLASLMARTDHLSGLTITTDLPSLAGFFSRHDLHIGAGGGATWERFCIGAPTLAIACADNQRAVLRQLVDLGCQYGVERLDRAEIAEALGRVLADPGGRRRRAAAAAGLVDGGGAARVAARIRTMAA